jgi:Flp pilus assembly protein TadG
MSITVRLRNEQGSTLVEVSVALLWVFMVIFALTESGRLMLAYTTLCNAARAGTRYAAVHGSYRTGSGANGPSGPGNTDYIKTVVKQVTTAAGLVESNVTVSDTGAEPMYPDGTNKTGARVRVKVSYPFTSVLPLIVPFSVTIGSTSEGTICY